MKAAGERDQLLVSADGLSAPEVRRALKVGLFTVTAETPRGYRVTLFGRESSTGLVVRSVVLVRSALERFRKAGAK